ncbi:hypothetical protein ACP70R_017091 [Stipagrostis hirtigluma subsp. patula]
MDLDKSSQPRSRWRATGVEAHPPPAAGAAAAGAAATGAAASVDSPATSVPDAGAPAAGAVPDVAAPSPELVHGGLFMVAGSFPDASPSSSDRVYPMETNEEVDECSSIDPMDLYTMEDFQDQQDILDDLADDMIAELKADVAALQDNGSTRSSGPRRYVDRPYEESEQWLMNDYFVEEPVYNETIFRRRFRMRKPLFLRIVAALSEWSPYFTMRMDALNRPGMSPLKKCTAAIRQLANGSPADQLDEYLKMGESTGVECLKMFVKGVIEVFGAEYLRRPTVEDVERLIQIGERRGFPGMLGSIDCMHWHWEKCPVAWKGMYTRASLYHPSQHGN